ncbi:hypothetical protein SMALB_8951 [Streptomyces malaysiensis]|uniref:Uncharacterized protein n=1 Tax=Streptomyces malaysiensis TaxID=92644 RepID=A0A7X5XCL6_STRMQ|nr:hypothetical protein [Streptomyces malaysiensis]
MQHVGDVLAQRLNVVVCAVDQNHEIVGLCRVPGYADYDGDSMTSPAPASEWSA